MTKYLRSTECILFEVKDRVARIALNRQENHGERR